MMLFILLSTLAWADIPTAPSTPTAVYDLKGLKPTSASVHNTAAYRKRHLRFKNDQGSHIFVFEETKYETPSELFFFQTMNNWNSICSVELECSAKAFCTEDCRTMYYPVASTPPESPLPPSKCRVRNLTCSPAPMPTPAPQEMSK